MKPANASGVPPVWHEFRKCKKRATDKGVEGVGGFLKDKDAQIFDEFEVCSFTLLASYHPELTRGYL